jgi:hypothetical protein
MNAISKTNKTDPNRALAMARYPDLSECGMSGDAARRTHEDGPKTFEALDVEFKRRDRYYATAALPPHQQELDIFLQFYDLTEAECGAYRQYVADVIESNGAEYADARMLAAWGISKGEQDAFLRSRIKKPLGVRKEVQ